MIPMKRSCIIFLSVAFSLNLWAQDINFSQFYELPLLRNPALAGVYNGDIRATSGFRTQWGSVTTPYQTAALGVEMKRSMGENSNDFMSFGLQITSDRAGDSKLTKTQLLPMLAYHKSVSREKDSYLTIGFLGGRVQQHFDMSALKFGDQFVAGAYSATNPTRQTFTKSDLAYWDASAGISFSSVTGYDTHYYLGVSYFHFTEPKVAFNARNDIRLNKKIVFNAGLSAPMTEFNHIVLYGDYFMQGGNSQVQAGLLFRHDIDQQIEDEPISLSVGGFYRWNDALVPVVKLDYYKVGIGLTYDVNMSKLIKASHGGGGFELTLSYRSFLNTRSTSAEKTRCPVSVR
jgi:type IX secretion system PorP/SprF family membrane protein